MSGADKQTFLQAIPVSRETMERLEAYERLVTKWTPAINLVASSTLPNLWSRHFLDSAQIFSLCPPGAETWADLGSGGGFPGLVIAMMAKEKMPGLSVTLVESDLRKAAFLATVARETGLDVTIRAERVEKIAPLNADVVSARALAPLSKLLSWARCHLKPEGRALFLKGAEHEAEILAARQDWAFELEKHRV